MPVTEAQVLTWTISAFGVMFALGVAGAAYFMNGIAGTLKELSKEMGQGFDKASADLLNYRREVDARMQVLHDQLAAYKLAASESFATKMDAIADRQRMDHQYGQLEGKMERGFNETKQLIGKMFDRVDRVMEGNRNPTGGHGHDY
jgi:hypothetical protein